MHPQNFPISNNDLVLKGENKSSLINSVNSWITQNNNFEK